MVILQHPLRQRGISDLPFFNRISQNHHTLNFQQDHIWGVMHKYIPLKHLNNNRSTHWRGWRVYPPHEVIWGQTQIMGQIYALEPHISPPSPLPGAYTWIPKYSIVILKCGNIMCVKMKRQHAEEHEWPLQG